MTPCDKSNSYSVTSNAFRKASQQLGSEYFNHYRPQRSCGKVMFSQASVILFTVGVCGRHPPADTPPADTPPRQTPPGRHPHCRHPCLGRHPSPPPPHSPSPWPDTPRADTPWVDPPGQTPPGRPPHRDGYCIILECILDHYCFVLNDI